MSLARPVIGITAGTTLADSSLLSGGTRRFVGDDYIAAVVQAGGIPIVLPSLCDHQIVEDQAKLCDGFILSGGGDIHPPLYGEEPYGPLGFVNQERDACEIQIVQLATGMNKPILGICRGLLILNVAFGGTLYQDISLAGGYPVEHNQNSPRQTVCHRVTLKPQTRLCDIIGRETVMTNSTHHQVLKDVAPGFTVNAWTTDGLIEGMEKRGTPFMLGVQWHPERMLETEPVMLGIFKKLIFEAKNLPHGS